MTKYLCNFFRKAQGGPLIVTGVDKILLGRWERTDRTLNKIKIDWANIDHCGTCAYASVSATKELPKQQTQQKQQTPVNLKVDTGSS
jgi:hypothetical protein